MSLIKRRQPSIAREIGGLIPSLKKASGLPVLLVQQKLTFARRVGQFSSIIDTGPMATDSGMAALLD